MSTSTSLGATSPIKFGTSGWRGLIADDFTFANVRLAVTAIAEHAKAKTKESTILVGYDTRFYSEEFSQLAVDILQHHGIRTLLCETFTPTPAVAFEIMRRTLDGAINFTASHNPPQYHGLKFSSADAGPALPEVTKDIEARAAQLAAKGGVPALPHGVSKSAHAEKVNLRENYLKRLEELVHFDTLRKAEPSLVVDALHGCGAGYLDRTLTDHGVTVHAMRTERDCLFDGTGPDVSEENLAPLRKAVVNSKATAGLATDGDADRFGIVDRDGMWIQPNLILALVYDYLVETRKWKMPAARSVATTQMIDAVAKLHGQTVHQTPVGFKYIGQLIREDKIALGGEESAALPSANKFARCTKNSAANSGPSARIFIFPTNKRQTPSSGWPWTLRHSPARKSYPSTAPMAQNLFLTTVRGCCCVFPARSRCFACTSKPKAPPLPRTLREKHRNGYCKAEKTGQDSH